VELIERSGIDVLICIPFSREFASITAQEFLQDLLVDRIGMRAIVVGKDYSFGKNRLGDVAFLKAHAKRFNYEVIVADWIPISNSWPDRISSTRIRELVMAGEVEKAQKLLGRNYQIRGSVVSGRNRGGKLLGCPTANLNLHDELCPKTGVYAVVVELGEERYKGVANIGYSPTFEDHLFTVEVHLLDFQRNIYGENMRVNFVQRIRDEIKFADFSELADQIQKDIERAREIVSL
jgi:riboflavin kinase/FMN adenylyltransferase